MLGADTASFVGSLAYVPPGYAELSDAERARICNGCGTAGWKGLLVPDNLFGLNVSDCCAVHDFEYEFGKTEEDKDFADLHLLQNLAHRVNEYERARKTIGRGTQASARRLLAMEYYNAVREHGDAAFWANKPNVAA